MGGVWGGRAGPSRWVEWPGVGVNLEWRWWNSLLWVLVSCAKLEAVGTRPALWAPNARQGISAKLLTALLIIYGRRSLHC